MKTSDAQTKSGSGKPKTSLSPELQELLHMLNALEAGRDAEVLAAR